jgi:hypothetical protein
VGCLGLGESLRSSFNRCVRDLVEGLAGHVEDRLEARVLRHASDRGVDVARLDLEPVPDATGPLRGEERRPRAGKAVEDDVPSAGAVEDRVGDEPNGFHRRVHGERLVAIGAELFTPA